jgi:signal transduction histidine kinase
MKNHHLLFAVMLSASLVALTLFFTVLLKKSADSAESQVSNQIELFREEIVRAIVAKDTFTLRRFAESFRRMSAVQVNFSFSGTPESHHASCEIGSEIPIVHMGVDLGKFHLCRNDSLLFALVLSDPLFQAASLVVLILFSFSTVFPIMIYRRKTNKILSLLRDPANPVGKNKLDDIQLRILAIVEENLHTKVAIEKQSALAALAAQVSHDIRSPLSALNMLIGSLDSLAEEKRLLVRNSVQRINDIANNLLDQSRKNSLLPDRSTHPKNPSNQESIQTCICLLAPIIDMIVSEKRIQVRGTNQVQIEADLFEGYGLFADVNVTQLKSVLSNLINNSIEAFCERGSRIEILLKNMPSGPTITVRDDGSGIPSEILGQLGQRGVTFGKQHSQSGSGIGLYHAKKMILAFGGKFEILSTEGVGTIVNLSFPPAQPPVWHVAALKIKPDLPVVALDDDQSIHNLWRDRFDVHPGFESKHRLINFTSEIQFQAEFLEAQLYLIDYELLGQTKTGLDLIEKMNIADRAVLVTSRYEEKHIIERCQKLGVKMIPKNMASLVPIQINKQKRHFDGILLDDDRLVHMAWEIGAKRHGKTLLTFESSDQLMEGLSEIAEETTFYIDSNLGQQTKGEDVARGLFERGFKNLYLATGYDPLDFAHVTWIKGIVGKDAPF